MSVLYGEDALGRTSRPTVLVTGPVPRSIGGMERVHAQMLSLDLGKRARLISFSPTASPHAGEMVWTKIRRHIRQLQRFCKALDRHNVRIVHLHTCSGFSFYRSCIDMLAARRTGRRTVLHIHGAKFDEFVTAGPFWRRPIVARLLSLADTVLALSDGWRQKLERIAPNAHVNVIENAVELPPEPSLADGPGACRFVLLARMDEWKGIDDLLLACRVLHREGLWFSVTLAGPPGSAGNANTLPAKIARHKLEQVVRYVGAVQGKDKVDLLTSANAYVQPSHHEGMPIAVLEALAYGLPIVATAVGALPEVIEPGRQGLLVPARQPKDLAAAMRTIIQDGSLRMRMAKAARLLAESRFGLNRFREDLSELYVGLMAPAGQGHAPHHTDGSAPSDTLTDLESAGTLGSVAS